MLKRFDLLAELDAILRRVAAEVEDLGPDFSPELRPAEPRFGDLQANGVLPWAKRNKLNPRALGERLLGALQADGALDPEQVEIELAGPGFLNFRFRPALRQTWIEANLSAEGLAAGAAAICHGRRVLIDFSSPNTAKQMHVGHIRSTVIGESLARILEFAGAEVIRDNHIGDWGTQFGLLILGIRREGLDLESAGENVLAQLEDVYRKTNAAAKEDEAILEEARAELVRLQQGEPDNVALWEQITAVSMQRFEEAYALLGTRFDHTLGESFYRDKVDAVCEELSQYELSEVSDGAQVVFHPEHKRFAKQPFIIRKRDGASNYATTDLATVHYRVETFDSEEVIYLTDDRQKDHFEQLFLTTKKWFEKRGTDCPTLRHVTFGKILGDDGKAIKTRTGEPIRLLNLLDEAVSRAAAIVEEKNPALDADTRAQVARTVGIGAVKYADLMQNRTRDYTFAWDKMLSFEGNTAPYLLYALTRLRAIFRKVSEDWETAEASTLETEEEIALARELMSFPQSLQLAVDELMPHHLAGALYSLAGSFSSFYNNNRVLGEEAGVEARRLRLCKATERVLETGLGLLTLETLEQM